MTLLITVYAAIIATVLWYRNIAKNQKDDQKLGVLCLIYWGASIMWFVDAIFEYIEQQEEYFHPAIADMVNDTFLGLSVVAFGLLIWLVVVLVKDPKGIIRSAILKQMK